MADQSYCDEAVPSRDECVHLSLRILAGIDQLAAVEAGEKAAQLYAAGAHIQLAIDILDSQR